MEQRKSVVWTTVVVLLLIALGGWWYAGSRVSESPAIQIGALIPITGKLASYGEDMQNALLLAEEEGKNGKTILRVIFEDSGADPKTSLSGSRKLVDIDRMPLVVGGPGSSAALAVAPVFQEKKIIFIPTSNTSKLNTAGDYIFKANPDVDFEAKGMVAYAREKGFRNVAILYDSANDTTTTGATVFREQFTKSGESVVFFEGMDSKITTDFRTQLTVLKKLKPDAIYVVINGKQTGTAIRQARELGLSVPFLGWSSHNDPELFTSAGGNAEGVVITDQPFSCEGTQVMRDYCAKYRARFSGRTPTSYGVTAYDVFRIISDVLSKNRSSAFGDTEKRLIQEAFTGKTYEGVSGTLAFDAEGNIRDKDFVFRVAKDGKFVELK